MINNYSLVDIGKRIKSERKARKLSQVRLMDLLRDRQIAISRTSLYRIEKGLPCSSFTFYMALALCEIFECEMGYLLCEEGYEAKTRKVTDMVKETGLTPEAVNRLMEINTPSILHTASKEEMEVRLEVQDNILHALSALITNNRFCKAVSGFIYHPENITTLYTHDVKGGRFSHSPDLIVMDSILLDSSIVEQALINGVTDSLKAIRAEIQKEK